MNIFNNIFIRLSIISTVYIIVLILVSPIIDHSFTPLDEDINMKETNFQILSEIILHVIVLAISWYFLNKYLRNCLENLMNIKMKEATKIAIDIISAIALVGLQQNLIDKLSYITDEHPFRKTDLYG